MQPVPRTERKSPHHRTCTSIESIHTNDKQSIDPHIVCSAMGTQQLLGKQHGLAPRCTPCIGDKGIIERIVYYQSHNSNLRALQSVKVNRTCHSKVSTVSPLLKLRRPVCDCEPHTIELNCGMYVIWCPPFVGAGFSVTLIDVEIVAPPLCACEPQR